RRFPVLPEYDRAVTKRRSHGDVVEERANGNRDTIHLIRVQSKATFTPRSKPDPAALNVWGVINESAHQLIIGIKIRRAQKGIPACDTHFEILISGADNDAHLLEACGRVNVRRGSVGGISIGGKRRAE